MSRFSTQLSLTLERIGINRSALAERSGIAYGSLTNYALDRRRIDPVAMSAICRALPRSEAAALLTARLQDELPKAFETLVSIEPTVETPVCKESQSTYRTQAELPEDIRTALARITEAATRTKEWRELLCDLARIC